MRLSCRVHPKASRERVQWDGTTAFVWVTAPAAEGQANRAVIRAVARWLDVAPSRVTMAAGAHSRTKLVDVEGVDEVSLADLSRG